MEGESGEQDEHDLNESGMCEETQTAMKETKEWWGDDRNEPETGLMVHSAHKVVQETEEKRRQHWYKVKK